MSVWIVKKVVCETMLVAGKAGWKGSVAKVF